MSHNINPFESPREVGRAVSDSPSEPSGPPAHSYRSSQPAGGVVMVLFATVVITHLLAAGLQYQEIDLLRRDHSETRPTPGEVQVISELHDLVIVGSVVAGLTSEIAFIVWFLFAHRNLPALGNTRLAWSPGWCVAAWFIPIGNCFLPWLIMREISRGSSPTGIDDKYRQYAGVSPWVDVWWGTVVLILCLRISPLFLVSPDSVDSVVRGKWLNVGANLAGALNAVLAILVVWNVVNNQEKRYILAQQRAMMAPAATTFETSAATPSLP
jgi:hypothetical protein